MTTEAHLSESSSGLSLSIKPSAWSVVRDIVSLTKPRLTSLVVVTTAGGLWLAHGLFASLRVWIALLATTLAVGAANTLNCYLERDLDRHMSRTRQRPLPSGRMSPWVALAVGVGLSLVSVPMLWVGVNPITAVLGAAAIASYVLVYTPMKTRSPAALMVGAVPGALPPLMGWTAITGKLDTAGMALFAVLFLWQMPHFLAIAIYRQDEYAAAGMKIMTLSEPLPAIRRQILAWTIALVPATLSLTWLGVAGYAYFTVAAVLGALFLAMAVYGFFAPNARRWGRQTFLFSLVYLTGIFVALMLDALRG